MKEQQSIVDLDQLAQHLKLSRRWLRAEAAAGRIPSLKAGAKLVFNPDAVEKAIVDRASMASRNNGSTNGQPMTIQA